MCFRCSTPTNVKPEEVALVAKWVETVFHPAGLSPIMAIASEELQGRTQFGSHCCKQKGSFKGFK